MSFSHGTQAQILEWYVQDSVQIVDGDFTGDGWLAVSNVVCPLCEFHVPSVVAKANSWGWECPRCGELFWVFWDEEGTCAIAWNWPID